MNKHTYTENIVFQEKLCAVVLKAEQIKKFNESGEKYYFYTPEAFPFQAGLQNRLKGECAPAHFHKPLPAFERLEVQEFLYVLTGSILIYLYYNDEIQQKIIKIAEIKMGAGDSIVLNSGHEIIFLEDTQFINIKQGPYRGKDEEKMFVSLS